MSLDEQMSEIAIERGNLRSVVCADGRDRKFLWLLVLKY